MYSPLDYAKHSGGKAATPRFHGFRTSMSYFRSYFEGCLRHRGTAIIHANSWNAFAFKRKSIPLVVTEQLGVLDRAAQDHKSELQFIYHQAVIRQFVKASFRLASAATAVSDYTALGLQRSLGIKSAKVIYNSVNTVTFTPAPEREGIRSGPFPTSVRGQSDSAKRGRSICSDHACAGREL